MRNIQYPVQQVWGQRNTYHYHGSRSSRPLEGPWIAGRGGVPGWDWGSGSKEHWVHRLLKPLEILQYLNKAS